MNRDPSELSLEKWLTRIQSELQDGGPLVDYAALHLYAARELPSTMTQVVRERISTWRNWHEVFWEIKFALAAADEGDANVAQINDEIMSALREQPKQEQMSLALPTPEELDCIKILARHPAGPFRRVYQRIREYRSTAGRSVPSMAEASAWLQRGVGNGFVARRTIGSSAQEDNAPGMREVEPSEPHYELAASPEAIFSSVCRSLKSAHSMNAERWLELDDLADSLGLAASWVAAFAQVYGNTIDEAAES